MTTRSAQVQVARKRARRARAARRRRQLGGVLAFAAIVALGRIAHDSVCTALGLKRSANAFGHGAMHPVDGPLRLFDSYHCSRYNTNTGVLTPEMFRAVFASVRAHLDGK